MERVTVRELNAENWYECCTLKVSEEQEGFVDSNALSIAQSKYEPTLKPLAIYLDEKIVGFTMYNTVKEELGGYWIYRIMVDHRFQKKGIGKKAMELVIEEMKKLEGCTKIVVGYVSHNEEAKRLYSDLGFQDRGERFGKEVAVVLEVQNS